MEALAAPHARHGRCRSSDVLKLDPNSNELGSICIGTFTLHGLFSTAIYGASLKRKWRRLFRLAKYEALLVFLFVLTLPLINPWVRGDGVGYYAFARSMLIEHRLDFTKDWLAANPSFQMGRIDSEGHLLPDQYTVTGHVNNQWAVGPAILWSPFLVVAHVGVLLCDTLGGHIAADGFSKPYVVAMALGTAFYGFLALFISFRLARRYVPEHWALLATLGIWFGSSLPVYMYFNPSYSHAHSAFTVALFLWYWIRTRDGRTWKQWLILGALGGLMLDVYYVSGVLLLFPLSESIAGYWDARKATGMEPALRLFFGNVIFAMTLLAAFLPTVIAEHIIYGSYFKTGYEHLWVWNSPALLKVCFSADHGLFNWNPILIVAVAGLFCLREYDRDLGVYSVIVLATLVYTIGCYKYWDGTSSFGNRFFISLTVPFVLGLAAFFDWLAHALPERPAAILGRSAVVVLIIWNLGLIFQWGMYLIPHRGPIVWRTAAYNQVAVVPAEASSGIKAYFTRRKKLMGHIEQIDVKQLKSRRTEETK
jgi:hypothetical protein